MINEHILKNANFNNTHDETIYLLTKENEQIKAENNILKKLESIPKTKTKINRLLAIPGFIIKILL
ncbi:MAG: hypothetical protein OHM56_01000 [Spiroplasma phoeniceum]|nr:MAG: hypothetical protein OHM57_00420 [Spiroplasma phoeniceum]UZQ32577.1 MAG: hypothetical protein OHM56_01000 [Spiroplasma phoeniceum]